MKLEKGSTLLFVALFGSQVLVLAQQMIPQSATSVTRAEPGLTFHDHPSDETLPATLEPSLFLDDPGAFVAYALASRIPAVLYQMPCYCYCNQRQGHRSLHDCYTSQHGRFCDICRMEAIFAFLETRKGKSPAEIRRRLAKEKAWKMNLDQFTTKWFPRLRNEAPQRSRQRNSTPRVECSH